MPISSYPLKVFESIGFVGLLFSLSLVICLTKYLDGIYHSNDHKPLQYIKYFILVSGCIGIILIVLGSVPQLSIFQILLEPVINFIYFSLWVKHNRIFYKTLRWRAIEFKVRCQNSRIVKNSVMNCHHFAVIMCLVGIGILCIFLAEFLEKYFFLISIAIRNGPCLFHYLYGTAYYEVLLTTKQQIDALNFSSKIVSCISTALVIFSLFAIGLQYLLAAIVFFGARLWKALKFRFGRVRTRFTPSLYDPLLIT